MLKRGIAELDPQIAVLHAHACTGCAACVETCPFGAISLVSHDGGEIVSGKVVLHDSCVYARYENVVSLSRAGLAPRHRYARRPSRLSRLV